MYCPFGPKIPQSENSRNIPNFILQNTGKQTAQTDITAGIFFLILYTVLGYLLQKINKWMNKKEFQFKGRSVRFPRWT